MNEAGYQSDPRIRGVVVKVVRREGSAAGRRRRRRRGGAGGGKEVEEEEEEELENRPESYISRRSFKLCIISGINSTFNVLRG